MEPRIIKTIILLLFTTQLWGQTTIRGTTKIETDGIISDSINNSPNKQFEKRIKIKPIDKSDCELEIRFYKLTALSNTKNLRIIKLKNDNWTALEYDEWNNPEKIKKYTLKTENIFDDLLTKLIKQNITRLPSQNELKSKMKMPVEIRGRQGEQHILVTDGHSYTVEFKIGDRYRIYDFSNPDNYANFYDNVEELKNYVAIKNIFDKELTRK